MNLIIDRKRWARITQDDGSLNGPSYLLNERGNMCCLGFDCANNGVSDERLLKRSYPYGISGNYWDDLPCSLTKEQAKAAIKINDRDDLNCHMTDAEQEAAIAAIFLQAGITVTFIN